MLATYRFGLDSALMQIQRNSVIILILIIIKLLGDLMQTKISHDQNRNQSQIHYPALMAQASHSTLILG